MNEIDKSLTDMFDAIFASYKSRPTPYKDEEHPPVETIKPRFNLRKDSSPLETTNNEETK